MKSIDTLIPDIYQLVGGKDAQRLPESLWEALGEDVSVRLRTQFGTRVGSGSLRLSQMGTRCPCALWYSVHHPELAESVPPWAQIKFSYGHILEAYAITLAKAAGHEVTGEQSYVELDGVPGHRDCIIDGCVVDVKSASSRSFIKFKDKSLAQDDPFGYLEQLDGYLCGSADDPLVRSKDLGYLWAIDKTLGHMVLYSHAKRESHIRERIALFKQCVEQLSPPECTCGTVPDGKSGNEKLDMRASYSPYKFCCFPKLRTFLYSDGRRYLVKVVRQPDVPEVDQFGKIIYG